MNCSLALLEAVAKYAFEIGLKPLRKKRSQSVRGIGLIRYLLLLAELVFVVKKLERVKDVLHSDQRISKVL